MQTVLHQNESIYGYGFLINGKAALKKHESADGYIAYTPQETFFITKVIAKEVELFPEKL